MNRKTFLKSLFAISGLPIAAKSFKRFSGSELEIVKPPKLKKGDKIGIIAPGAYIVREELNKAIENAAALDLEPIYREDILSISGYLAGEDKKRWEEVNEMFERKEIKAIFCSRGGYGSMRILDKIDYNLVRKNPKIFIGYSDITALQFGLLKKSGLVVLHGPVGISSFDEFSISYLKNFLFENFDSFEYENYKSDDRAEPICLLEGEAEGRLIGGNLSILVSLIGTEWDIDYDEKIVFIEETDEEPYRVDRMLTQMRLTKKFEKAKGIIFGVFNNCERKAENPAYENSFSLLEVLKDFTEKVKLPCSYGFSFGHIPNKFSLPIGCRAYFNASRSKLVLLESFTN